MGVEYLARQRADHRTRRARGDPVRRLLQLTAPFDAVGHRPGGPPARARHRTRRRSSRRRKPAGPRGLRRALCAERAGTVPRPATRRPHDGGDGAGLSVRHRPRDRSAESDVCLPQDRAEPRRARHPVFLPRRADGCASMVPGLSRRAAGHVRAAPGAAAPREPRPGATALRRSAPPAARAPKLPRYRLRCPDPARRRQAGARPDRSEADGSLARQRARRGCEGHDRCGDRRFPARDRDYGAPPVLHHADGRRTRRGARPRAARQGHGRPPRGRRRLHARSRVGQHQRLRADDRRERRRS